MTLFRALLVVIFGVIFAYTVPVVQGYGLNLFPYFFGDIAEMGWPGQFNLDFMFMLFLSALWTAWRNRFSHMGLGLSVIAFLGGAPFLCLYLLWLSIRHKGDIPMMLTGRKSADVA